MSDATDPAPQALAPLWSDERIEDFANAKYDASEYFEVFGAMVVVRDDYEAELATAQARIESLEEQLDIAKSQVKAALREAGRDE